LSPLIGSFSGARLEFDSATWKFFMGLKVSLAILIFSWLAIVGCAQSATQLANPSQPTYTQHATPIAASDMTLATLTQNTSPAATSKGTLNACALLASSELKSVQGEEPKESKPSTRVDNTLAVSQCFYWMPTYNKSVSLEVTRSNSGKPGQTIRQFWKDRFPDSVLKEKEDERERERERGKDKEERESEGETQKPLKITGVGDEAFWTGSAIAGALYVLKGKSYLRLSIGGTDDRDAKIKKLKTLAQHALKRLK
jgi:hypothetical protein